MLAISCRAPLGYQLTGSKMEPTVVQADLTGVPDIAGA
jgi:hypothetical protein